MVMFATMPTATSAPPPTSCPKSSDGNFHLDCCHQSTPKRIRASSGKFPLDRSVFYFYIITRCGGKHMDKHHLKVADEVWIATALLHRENPSRDDFKIQEIVERAAKEAVTGGLRPGVYVHALQHCVANRPPNPGRYRMLFSTEKNTRRLFRPGDAYHPAREGSKVVPAKEEVPAEYHHLVDWYLGEYAARRPNAETTDPILQLLGLGKEIWKGEDPDTYVRRLRQGWE